MIESNLPRSKQTGDWLVSNMLSNAGNFERVYGECGWIVGD